MALKEAFESLLTNLKMELRRHYGARLISALVYGSVGRGTQKFESDVDLLIVAEPLPRGRMARVRDFSPVEDSLESKIRSMEKMGIFTTLAPIFKTSAEVHRGSLLFLDMIDDGRILYDRSGFWKTYRKTLLARLRRLGAKKINQGDRWYWDLKPDYRPGDIFEI